jgi:transcriptional regulator with XRE-family HTH domain
MIRDRRRELGLTQRELAAALGVSELWVRQIECGRRLPSLALSLRMSDALKLPPAPICANDELAPALQRWFSRSEPWRLPKGSPHLWELAYTLHRDVLGFMGTPELPDWFKQSVRCDSNEEPVAWLSLVAHGATACTWSPYLAGIACQPLLDENRQALGVRRLPALLWDLRTTKSLIFPQLHSRPEDEIYRSDGIGVVQDERHRQCFAVEFDGGGHNPRRDKRQERQFRMPIVRISSEQVLTRQVPELLRVQFRLWGFDV